MSAIVAPDTTDRPAAAYYEVSVLDLVKQEIERVPDVPFYWGWGREDPVHGKMPDSHVVFVDLEHNKDYRVMVQGFTAGHIPGLRSVWSDTFEHEWEFAIPDTVP